MAINALDEDRNGPERDKSGRFQPGSTGNPNGRPRKQPQTWSFASAISDALSEVIPVEAGGDRKLLTVRDFIVKGMVRAIPKTKPKEILAILERLENIGALMSQHEEPEDIFTEEDRRLLELVQRDIEASSCCTCGGFVDRSAAPLSDGGLP